MQAISYQIVKAADTQLISCIAEWYLSEWKIPVDATIQRLSNFQAEGVPFQIILFINNVPIATGGIYNHVGLLDQEPKFKIHGPWLALVYTIPDYRGKGYGALLCEKIQEISKELELKELFLFTDTAERLYTRLGWESVERLNVKNRDIVVMKKVL